MANTLRISSWCAFVFLVLGQLLSWGGQRPATEVWKALFSRTLRPNPEWWIWFLAPTIAALLTARDLHRRQKVSSAVLIPIAVFFVTWVALFPLGTRVYLRLHAALPGYALTVVGLILLGAVATIGMKHQKAPPLRRPAAARRY
jgi:hypothetical protein